MNANELFNVVMQLDLTSIKNKLMHVPSGEGWSLDKANAVEKEYRRFLCLIKLFPEEDTAPLVDVDTFWHYHILDTMKYAADCEQVFGYFLHHDPSVGLDGTEQAEQFRLDSGERMRQLHEATFGEAYVSEQFDEPALFALTHADATAYCASPHIGTDTATAYSASPHIGKIAARGKDAATAYCASPHKPKEVATYCASTVPHERTHPAVHA